MVRDPDTITVAEVLKAAGEQIIFPECTTPEGCELAHQRGHVCASSHFWQNLNSMVNKIAEETTVGSLIRNYEEEMGEMRAEKRQ